MAPSASGARFGRDEALVAVSVVAAIGVDAVAGLDGLRLPVYTGLVLVSATRLGALTALSVGLVTAAAHVWLGGADADGLAIAGAVTLLLGASTVGLAVDRSRRRMARLEQVIEVLRRETAPRPPSAPLGEAGRPRGDASGAGTDRLPRLLYRYARLLNVSDEDALYTGLALTLEEVLPARMVAVYRLVPGGLELAAGDPLDPPPRALVEQADGPVFVSAADPRRVYGRVRDGDGALTAVLVVLEPGAGRNRRGALKLLATFVDWASASVGHARALRRLDDRARAESARIAEAGGRAAARTFARTGKIPLIEAPPADDPMSGVGRARAPRPARPAIAGQPRDTLRPTGPDRFAAALESTAEDDDTERVDPGAVADALGEARRSARPRDDRPFGSLGDERGPALPPRRDTDETPAPRIRPTVIDPPTGGSARIAPPSSPPPDPASRSADPVDGDVRAAIERMAHRLKAGPPSSSGSGDDLLFPAPALTDLEVLAHDRIDDDMVAADELPLIGGPGLGVAAEVGRSPVKGRFAHLLADLSDHLGAEGEGS